MTTTLDPGMPSAQQTKTTQVVDSHGNVTQTAIYDYGNLTTPARTYTNSWPMEIILRAIFGTDWYRAR